MAECIINRPAGLEFITLLDEDISGTGATGVPVSSEFRIPEGTLFIIFQVLVTSASGAQTYLHVQSGQSSMPAIGKILTGAANLPAFLTDIFMANGTDNSSAKMKYFRFNNASLQPTYLPISSPWQLILYQSSAFSQTMSITGHAKVTAIKIP